MTSHKLASLLLAEKNITVGFDDGEGHWCEVLMVEEVPQPDGEKVIRLFDYEV